METLKTQVVIVGAGPTGLSMAAQLIRYGVDFIIIEKNEKITSLSKAIAVQARTLEIFQELGIADEAIKRGQITTGLNLYYKGVRKLNVNISGLGKGLSNFPFALSLEQSKTEALLLEYIQSKGKQVLWKCEITRSEQDSEGVTAYYKDPNGNEQKIEANYLIGCDGARSEVRHQLDLPFKGGTEPKLFYVADVLLKSDVIKENALYMYMIKKGFVLFFPLEGEGHYRLVGVIPEGLSTDHEYIFSEIEQAIKPQIITPVSFEKLQWFSTYKVHTRKADSFMKGRCFIVGDAAHIHTPAGGQGMNTGIQDAYNLAWKIAYTIRGEVSEQVLKSYDAERTANAKHLLQTTDRMFDVMSGVNPFWNFFRLNFFPVLLKIVSNNEQIKRKIFPLISQTGIAYPDSYLTFPSSIGKVKAGDRMHYFVFSNGKQIFDYLVDPVFKLLYFGSGETNETLLLQDAKIKIVFLAFKEVPVSVFGKETNFYILLRPDNHISYIGKDSSKCKEVIQKISK